MNENAVSPTDPQYQRHEPSYVDQSVAGQSLDLVWILVDEVERAFLMEAAALSGKQMLECEEVTNATLRTAWPFVLKALEGVKRG